MKKRGPKPTSGLQQVRALCETRLKEIEKQNPGDGSEEGYEEVLKQIAFIQSGGRSYVFAE